MHILCGLVSRKVNLSPVLIIGSYYAPIMRLANLSRSKSREENDKAEVPLLMEKSVLSSYVMISGLGA